MSSSIPQAWVDQFDSHVHYLGQQKVDRLAGHCYDRSGQANGFRFDRLAPEDMVPKAARHSETPILNIAHSNRWAIQSVFDWGDAVDKDDDVQVIIDPQSKYVQSAGFALGRRHMQTKIDALGGDAKEGAAKDTAADIALPAAQKIGASASAADKLTVDLLRQSKAKLDAAEIEGDRTFVHSAESLQDLLEDPEVTSADYNNVRALVQGEVDTYMGFRFVRSELLPLTGNSRLNYAYVDRCLGFATAMREQTRVQEDPGLRFAVRIFKCTVLGAVRIEDKGVVEIETHE